MKIALITLLTLPFTSAFVNPNQCASLTGSDFTNCITISGEPLTQLPSSFKNILKNPSSHSKISSFTNIAIPEHCNDDGQTDEFYSNCANYMRCMRHSSRSCQLILDRINAELAD